MRQRRALFFGGLPPNDAELAARFAYSGQFDLEKVKHVFDKPVTVDQIPEWLQSQSESIGSATNEGTNWSRGGSNAKSPSTTKSQSITQSFGVTNSTSDTIGKSDTVSTAHTASRSGATSQSDAEAFSRTNSWSTSPSEGGNSSTSSTRS